MLLCDHCSRGQHTFCIGLKDILGDNVYCSSCEYEIFKNILDN